MPNVERLIQDAMARGEFDNLPGQGKPIDLSAYFDTPEELRMAYSVLKSADVLPQEVELLKEIANLQEKLDATHDLAKRSKLKKELEEKRLNFNLMMERIKRQKKAGL
jgi:hypothetical protein